MFTVPLIVFIFLIQAPQMVLSQAQKPDNGTVMSSETLCATSIQTCTMACNGTTPIINECVAKDMKWDCLCAPGKQVILDAAFPIPYYQCQEALTKCMQSCPPSENASSKTCLTTCETKHQCGSQNAPPNGSKKSNDSATAAVAPNSASQVGMGAASSLMVLCAWIFL